MFRAKKSEAAVTVIWGIVVFVATVIAMLCAIFLANLIPSDRIFENVKETIYSKNYVSTPFGKGDNFTECVASTIGVPPTGAAGDPDPMMQGILSPTYWNCEDFKDVVRGNNDFTNYWRYWHGYQIVTRPILFIAGFPGLRWLAVGCFTLSAAFFFFELIRLRSPAIFLSAIACLLLFPLYTKIFYIVHAFVWIIAFLAAGLAIAVSFRPRSPSFRAYCLTALLVGMATAFFDFLTNPILTLSLPLVAILWSGRPGDAFAGARTWRFVVLAGVWAAGYFGCWAAKWVIVSALTGEDAVGQVLQTISTRLSGEIQKNGGMQATIVWSIQENLRRVHFAWILLPLLLVVGVWRTVIAASRQAASLDSILSAAFVVMLPFVWLAAARNHSIIHAAFVAPILFPSFALLASICLAPSTIFQPRSGWSDSQPNPAQSRTTPHH
jgi:hypothetical protein